MQGPERKDRTATSFSKQGNNHNREYFKPLLIENLFRRYLEEVQRHENCDAL